MQKPKIKLLRFFQLVSSLFLSIVSLYDSPLYAASVISEDSIGNTTFTCDKSLYIVQKDIVIKEGCSVIIEKGCQFFFKTFTGIIVHGNLIVQGTIEHPVLFTSINDTLSPKRSSDLPNPFDWNGIFISEQANRIELSDFILTYSVYGIKSQKESFIIRNGYFKNNGQYHCTIHDEVEPVGDGIPFAYINYTVTYDPNMASSGKPPVDSIRYNKGKTVQIPNNIGNLVKPGHQFIGWNSSSNGSGKDYEPGTTFLMENADVKLYAKWIVDEAGGKTSVKRNANKFLKKGVPLLTGGTGLISGIVSVFFMKQWLSNKDTYRNVFSSDERNRLNSKGKMYSGISIATGTVSLIAIPTGIVLYILNNNTDRTEKHSSITPFLSSDIAGIELTLIF